MSERLTDNHRQSPWRNCLGAVAILASASTPYLTTTHSEAPKYKMKDCVRVSPKDEKAINSLMYLIGPQKHENKQTYLVAYVPEEDEVAILQKTPHQKSTESVHYIKFSDVHPGHDVSVRVKDEARNVYMQFVAEPYQPSATPNTNNNENPSDILIVSACKAGKDFNQK